MTTLDAASHLPYPGFGTPIEAGQSLPAPVDAVPVTTVEALDNEPGIRIFTANPGDTSSAAQQTRILAQQLHTDVYLESGIIQPHEVNEVGLFVDKYSDRATYHYVKNGHKVTAARQVMATKKGGILSLPTAENFALDPESIKKAAGVNNLSDIKHDEVVEISGLVARKKEGGPNGNFDAVIALYCQMLRNSLEEGHKLWLLNVEPGFIRRLNFLVGADQIHQLGEPRKYMGPATTPVALNPQEIVRKILGSDGPEFAMQRGALQQVFSGIGDKKIPQDIRELLDKNGIQRGEYPAYKRAATSPTTLAQIGMMGFTVTRDMAAINTDGFQGDPALLLGIDMATSVMYTQGLIEAYTGKTVGRKVLGAAIAAPAFVAPYAYFYAEGRDYPPAVNAVIASLVGGAVVKEVISRRLSARRERRLVAGLQAAPTSSAH